MSFRKKAWIRATAAENSTSVAETLYRLDELVCRINDLISEEIKLTAGDLYSRGMHELYSASRERQLAYIASNPTPSSSETLNVVRELDKDRDHQLKRLLRCLTMQQIASASMANSYSRRAGTPEDILATEQWLKDKGIPATIPPLLSISSFQAAIRRTFG